ncbi:MAG: hypothetical protein J0I68_30775 [Achromobacter sp.]|uniref:hypothetical protein n=1 Tax=unclassified Achromobacter TaxID=2626865 RepID=UPI0006BED552|nr:MULTISPECIES: hypothetical protein [unclassified Achromobacter]MBN9642950.1 hypothetical protein [Achromobacter sp.]CUJ80825.1 Uncharacterised protein [Achromobacter sp. 2789STDY5608628]
MTTKHTPGPWSLETVRTSSGVCHKVGPFPGRREDHPPRHACLYADYPSDSNPSDQELLANARIESGLLYEGESKALASELREAADDLSPRDTPELDEYDAGILGSAGGGDVDWWQDYLRAELERAHAFYQSQQERLL